MQDYWHRAWKCPYYKSNDKLVMHCEGRQRLVFPDRGSAKRYIDSYCANMECWRRCTVARMLNEHYEEEQ